MFYFELAQRCGYPHPDLMLDKLTSKQITECIAFDNLNPQGQWRADFRNALLCTVVNATGFNRRKSAKISDYMPKFIRQAPKTASQLKNIMHAFAARFKK